MAQQTCLQIIQRVCKMVGIVPPNAAVGATDPQIMQLVAISEEEGNQLVTRGNWTALQFEAVFTTVATEIQGSIDTIAPGCLYVVNDTIWNRDQGVPVFGPVTQQDYQQIKSQIFTGPYNQYRIKNNNLHYVPTPQAGMECAFEYISENWIYSGAKTPTTYRFWQTDSDTPFLKDDLIVLGTIWRWKKVKGLEYAEDFNTYERAVIDALNRDGSKPQLSMDGGSNSFMPAVVVPIGSWNA